MAMDHCDVFSGGMTGYRQTDSSFGTRQHGWPASWGPPGEMGCKTPVCLYVVFVPVIILISVSNKIRNDIEEREIENMETHYPQTRVSESRVIEYAALVFREYKSSILSLVIITHPRWGGRRRITYHLPTQKET